MKKEIRKDVREYILSQVNETLARLGISENVVETREHESRHYDKLYYEFESAPIKQMPVMFKKLVVDGDMVALGDLTDESDDFYKIQKNGEEVVVVSLSYSYDHFDRGSNGCNIGRMIFLVKKELPADFTSDYLGNVADLYIRKFEGLQI